MKRADIIQRLVEDIADNLQEFALRDRESLEEYVREAEKFEDYEDADLVFAYEHAFDEADVVIDDESTN